MTADSPGTEFLTINGVRLETRRTGPDPDHAPMIVMLHEGLGAVTTWRDFPERLAEATGHHVFAYARQGYGRSDPCALPRPLDYMTREAVDVLPPLLDTIGFVNGVLLGHSDGGSIAAIYGGRFENTRVTSLILMAPHFFTEDAGIAAIAAANRAYEATDLRDRLQRHHGDNVDCAFRGWADAWLDPAFRQWDIRGDLAGVTAPTLVIQGRQDEYGTDAQVEAVKSLVKGPVETALLDSCGHAPFRDRPNATLSAIKAFLERPAPADWEL